MIGALEAVRVLILLLAAALVLSVIAWFIGIAQQRPLSAVLTWAAGGLAAVHGFSVELGSFVHSLPPSAFTVPAWLLIGAGARRTARALTANERLAAGGVQSSERLPRLLAGVAFGGVYVLVTAAVTGLASTAAFDPLGVVRLLLLVGSAVLLGLGLGPGSDAAHRLVTRTAGPRWGSALASGHRAFLRVGIALLGLGVLAAIAALVVGRQAAAATLQLYSDPSAAAVGLTAVQLIFAPTVLVLALAWVSGAGFHLAAGTIASPFTAIEAPVAGIPVLATVPQHPADWTMVLPVAVVLCGLVAVLGRTRWHLGDLRAVAVMTAELFLAALLTGLFAHGAVGPGGLLEFGISPLLFAVVLGGEAGLGALLGWGMLRLAGRSVTPDTAVP